MIHPSLKKTTEEAQWHRSTSLRWRSTKRKQKKNISAPLSRSDKLLLYTTNEQKCGAREAANCLWDSKKGPPTSRNGLRLAKNRPSTSLLLVLQHSQDIVNTPPISASFSPLASLRLSASLLQQTSELLSLSLHSLWNKWSLLELYINMNIN